MNTDELLVQHFYTCFQNRDYKGMQACYADKVVFNDEVFVDLNAEQVKAMWEMLITRGKDLSINYGPVKTAGRQIVSDWTARYTFTTTGKKVVNTVRASIVVKEGKIVQHTDRFNFSSWARQALGWKGLLFGHTRYLRDKVRRTASQSLETFMDKQLQTTILQ